MARMSLARAAVSPLALALGAGGAAVGFALAEVPGAVGIGLSAWALRMATAGPRQPRPERVDPFTLQDPWRRSVQDALQARTRFRAAVGDTRDGPIRERLEDIARQVDRGVDEAWRVAKQGHALAQARRRIDTRRVERELTAGPAVEGTADALRAQLDSAGRIDETIDDARGRLRLTNARLDEAAARAAELSLAAHDVGELQGLGADVDAVVTDLEALRLGLEEVQRPGLP